MSDLLVGVVGAGTMGLGIAQVAAAAGHRVFLHDMQQGAAERAHERIGAALSRRVADGKMSSAERHSILSRIGPKASLHELAPCGLIIEAIVEAMEPKRGLFADLELLVASDTVLATNTSSLSITALARHLKHPQRFIGLHFFNPVPAMRLVEVIRGMESGEDVALRVERLMQAWGKTAVAARSTPGFIVNRIARPFYAEALWLIEERRATPAQIDACLRAAGFRMGPCELMDLIGHDVNYAVTESVFAANFGDTRFVPSRFQRELVESGRLGRKSGRGFYSYGQEDSRPEVPADDTPPASGVRCILKGVGRLADCFQAAMGTAGVPCERQFEPREVELCLESEDQSMVTLTCTDGRTAAQIAAERGSLAWAVVDWIHDCELPSSLAIAFPDRCPLSARLLALSTLRALGVAPVTIADAPGLVVGRTIAMLINEAADAVQQQVCDGAAADTAMKLGANYPAGPFEWLAHFGTSRVVKLLRHLQDSTHPERYRLSPWLWERYWNEAAGA